MSANTRSTIEQAGELWDRRKWLFLTVFIAIFASAVTAIINLPKLYRSTATAVVGQENISDNFVKSSVSGETGSRLQTIKYAVLSRPRLQELIKSLNLYPELRREVPMEIVVDRMRKDIQFTVENAPEQWGEGDAIAFSISYQGFDPQLVAQVTNRLAYSYVEENRRIRSGQATTTAAFLKQQLDEAKLDLEYQQRSAVKDEVVVNPDANRRNEESLTQLAMLKQELTLLRSRFTEKYPDVVRLKNQIARIEKEVKPAPSITRNNNQQAGTSLVQLSRERYMSLLARYEDAQLAEMLEQDGVDQFRILENAVPSTLPIEPNVLRLAVMGFVVAVLLAVGLVVLSEQLDTSFHSTQDLKEFTRVPVLVTIPRILTTSDRIRHWLWTSIVSVVVIAGIAVTIHFSYTLARGNEQAVWILSERGI